MNQFIQKILCNNERKKFKKQARMQPVVRKEYPDVCVISDVPYTYGDCESDPGDTYDPDFKMDLYHIDNREEKSPVIISVHGGGLMTGSKEFNRSMCMELANHGFLVFAIEYPKLPPCILFTSAGDFLKSQSQAFEKSLKDNGVVCRLEYYDDPELVHDFPLFQCDRPETEDVIGKIVDFFWGCVDE